MSDDVLERLRVLEERVARLEAAAPEPAVLVPGPGYARRVVRQTAGGGWRPEPPEVA